MPEDIQRVDNHENAEYRSASTNAALGIAAYVATKPQVDKVVGQVVDKVVDTIKPKKD